MNADSGCHAAPDLAHTCGVYATRTHLQARSWAGVQDEQRIIGRVSLWGRVRRYTEGFRAEYAYPLELVLPPVLRPGFELDHDELVLWLEEASAVPVRIGSEEYRVEDPVR